LLQRTNDTALQLLIKGMDDSVIEGLTVEALVKMARKGSSANQAIAATSGHVLPVEGTDHPHESLDASLIHDNLSHHLSHYNAALKSGNRDLADKHLDQVMRTINYGTKLEGATARKSHPEGVVRIRSGSTQPYSRDESGNLVSEGAEGKTLMSPSAWEMNYSGSERKPNGVLKEVTKGWNRQPTKGRKESDMFPNFKYMEMKPHPHSKSELYGHEQSAYPFHDLQVNGRYVDIHDVDPSKGFVDHPFDTHPGRGHAYTHSTDLGPTAISKFTDEHKQWLNSPAFDSWLKVQEAKHEDPEYSNRGIKRSEVIHRSAMDNPHDLISGRRSGKSSQVTDAPQTSTSSPEDKVSSSTVPATDNTPTTSTVPATDNQPIASAADQGSSEPPHPQVVGIVKRLAQHTSPDKISAMLGLSPEQVKAALESK